MNVRLLKQFLSQPTAPFREECVARVAAKELEKAGVPFFTDPAGNLVVGVESKRAYVQRLRRKTKEPIRLFIAHMDHPGFHLKQWVGKQRARFEWHGGGPKKDLVGAKVWLADSSGYVGDGRLTQVKMNPKFKYAIQNGVVQVPASLRETHPDPSALFGGFGFRAPVWKGGPRFYTKAADDLIGVYTIVSMAMRLWKTRHRGREPFVGLLTRGEEVGFIGAVAHFELGWLEKRRRDVIAVSLETSRTLPGAEFGKGPVVRLGDRFNVFDANSLLVLDEVAKTKIPKNHQRRIMDGGTCEATAAMVYGIPSIGISIPLGNYHNQNFEGGPDSRKPDGPAPEYVHEKDIKGLMKLSLGLLEPGLPWQTAARVQRRRLLMRKRHYARYL